MRSEIAPQICRPSKPSPSSSDSIAAPCDAEMPRSVQNATRWPAASTWSRSTGTRRRRASRTPRSAASRTPAASRPPRRQRRPTVRVSGGGRRKISASGTITADCEHAVGHHRGAPAVIGDRALEDRRPHRAGEIEPARDQRQRRAAAAVEPAADIDIERRIEAGIAEQADEQAVTEIELPGLAEASRCRARCRSTRRRRSPSCGCRSGRRAAPSAGRRTEVPNQASELASDGAERAPPRSAAIVFRPTATIHSAPNDRAAARAKRSRRPRRIASRCLACVNVRSRQ